MRTSSKTSSTTSQMTTRIPFPTSFPPNRPRIAPDDVPLEWMQITTRSLLEHDEGTTKELLRASIWTARALKDVEIVEPIEWSVHKRDMSGNRTSAILPTPAGRKSLYKSIPLPPENESGVYATLNPSLQFWLCQEPRFRVDLTRSPTEIQEPWTGSLLEAAMNPPVRSMAVICEEISRPIVIHASQINPVVVTVADVLGMLCYVFGSAAAQRWANGWKRGNRFLGLSASDVGPETWVLHVA